METKPDFVEVIMPNETGRDLDAAIAREVMGIDVVDTYIGPCYKIDPESNYYQMDVRTIELYSSDRNAARLVLAEIERRSASELLICQLFEMGTIKATTGELDFADIWACLTASPEAIGLAALAAVRGGKG